MLQRNVGQYHAALVAPPVPQPYATTFKPRTPSPSTSTSNAALANAVALAATALEHDTTRTPTSQAALQALRHVSSVLAGTTRELDPAVLAPLQSPTTGRDSLPASPAQPPLSASTTSSKAPSLLLSTRDARPLSTSLPRVPYSADAWRQAAKWTATSPIARTPSPGTNGRKSFADDEAGVGLGSVRGDARRVIDDPLGAV